MKVPHYSEATKGDAAAQFNLALTYQDGNGLPRDYEKAAYWYRAAARQGHSPAQYSLALMYCKGQGMPKDDRESFGWCRKAAERGHQAAQFNLATMYDQGVGVERNPVLAYVWFAMAGAKGPKSAPVSRLSGSVGQRLALSSARGHTVADNNRNRLALALTPKQRETAERLARDYYEKYVLTYR